VPAANLPIRWIGAPIKVEAQITGDGTSTYWDLPGDYDRLVPGEAFWSLKYPAVSLGGPVLDEEMLAMKALPVQPVRPIWRLFGNQVEIWPALASGEIVKLQYRSAYWIVSSDGATVRNRWLQDTDLSLVDENLLTMSLIWRWKRAKGFDYAEEFRSFEMARVRKAGQDAGSRLVRTAVGLRPDGIWGPSPINPIIVT